MEKWSNNMSVWFGWPPGNDNKIDKTYHINCSNVNINYSTGNIFNGSITTTFKNSNFIGEPISTFRDTATFTINPFDKKHAVEEEKTDFEKELIEKLKDKEFQAAARQRYKILAGIVKADDENATSRNNLAALYKSMHRFDHDDKRIMSMEESAAYFNKLCDESAADDVMSREDSAKSLPKLTGFKKECDSMVVNPTVRSGKTIKELTQELQYDLERQRDVKGRENLIMQCARYIRLERMSESLNDLT